MPRYILVSFIFMGWAFYELSGGADFVAPTREPVVEVVAAAEASPAPARTEPAAARPAQPVEQPQVAALQPATERTASATTRTEAVILQASSRPLEDSQMNVIPQSALGARVNILDGLSQFSNRPSLHMVNGVQVASLGNDRPIGLPEEEPAQVAEPAQPQAEAENYAEAPAVSDMREVVGSHVNMRTEPTTQSDIMARLDRGHPVEVLGDNKRGWLRIRIMPEDRVGWIAERLISPSETIAFD